MSQRMDTARDEHVAVRPFPGLDRLGETIRISVGTRPEVDRFLQALDEVVR